MRIKKHVLVEQKVVYLSRSLGNLLRSSLNFSRYASRSNITLYMTTPFLAQKQYITNPATDADKKHRPMD